MVDIHDRRESSGPGDFNNPAGTWSLTTHGDSEAQKWSGVPYAAGRAQVHQYYAGQKDSKTWQEATRLAKQRTDHQARKWGSIQDTAAYADAYQEHLVRVMSLKGHGMAEQFGELSHRQSGYGRT